MQPATLPVPETNQRMLPRQSRRVRVAIGRIAFFTFDISPGGFCAEMIHALGEGAPVSGSICLGAKEFPFIGQVAWSKQGEPGLRRLGRVGIRFTSIENGFFTAFDHSLHHTDEPVVRLVQGRARRDPETPSR